MKNNVWEAKKYLVDCKNREVFDLSRLIRLLTLSPKAYFFLWEYHMPIDEFLNMSLLGMRSKLVEIFINNFTINEYRNGEQLCEVLGLINYNDFLRFESYKNTFIGKIEAYIKHQMIEIIKDLHDDDLLFLQKELEKEE